MSPPVKTVSFDIGTFPEDEKETVIMSRPDSLSLAMDETAQLMEKFPSSHKGLQDWGHHRPNPYSSAVMKLLSLSNMVLITIVIFLAFGRSRDCSQNNAEPSNQPYSHQPPWLPPNIPVNKTLFFNRMYGRPPDEENTKAWNEMMPLGRGFVVVKNESALEELPSFHPELPEQHGMVSVFHQLHCIWATKDSYFRLLSGDDLETDVLHLSHCWDYLRQTTMCNADLTMEWMPNTFQGTSKGWGYQHQCRDFDAIFKWTLENHWENGTGIH